MSFERFTYTKRNLIPKITLTKDKLIFNIGAIKLFDLYTNHYIALYYDKRNKLIGFQPEYKRSFDNYELIYSKTNLAKINIIEFINHYKIKYQEPMQYRIMHKNSFYCIDLKE